MFSVFADGPGLTGAITVTTSASEVKVGGSALSERKYVIIQPINNPIYWSYDSGVTSSTGHYIPSGTLIYVQAGEKLPVYVIAAANTDVRISEIA